MPEISRFFGIVIQMYFDDHNPPHFHARYAGFEAEVGIDPLAVIAGSLPPRERSLVLEWAALYNAKLMDNWSRLQSKEPPRPIPPLE